MVIADDIEIEMGYSLTEQYPWIEDYLESMLEETSDMNELLDFSAFGVTPLDLGTNDGLDETESTDEQFLLGGYIDENGNNVPNTMEETADDQITALDVSSDDTMLGGWIDGDGIYHPNEVIQHEYDDAHAEEAQDEGISMEKIQEDFSTLVEDLNEILSEGDM